MSEGPKEETLEKNQKEAEIPPTNQDTDKEKENEKEKTNEKEKEQINEII